MADFEKAFTYLMQWEDDGLSGRITSDAGGRTRFGIAERFHPELTPTHFYDSLPDAEAMMLAKDTYERGYWTQMAGGALDSQQLANKMLSLGVNLGMERVIRWAQEAAEVQADGSVGPATLAAWNKSTGSTGTGVVLHAISVDAEGHYRQRAEESTSIRAELHGLLRRAQDSAIGTDYA